MYSQMFPKMTRIGLSQHMSTSHSFHSQAKWVLKNGAAADMFFSPVILSERQQGPRSPQHHQMIPFALHHNEWQSVTAQTCVIYEFHRQIFIFSPRGCLTDTQAGSDYLFVSVHFLSQGFLDIDLTDLRKGGANITGFQLVNNSEPSVSRVVQQWMEFDNKDSKVIKGGLKVLTLYLLLLCVVLFKVSVN